MRVSFIGLGAMGSGMARTLLRHGYQLSVFDQSESKRAPFEGLCTVGKSSADVAANAVVVICMLPTTNDVREALLGNHGAVQTLPKGSIVMDMGTGNPIEMQMLHRELQANGIHLVDAPVNRAPPEAACGQLLAMVGGEDAQIETVYPLLQCLCSDIYRTGAFGSGIRMKLANNYMSMINLVLTAEGLLLAERAGIDRKLAVEIMSANGNGATNGQLLTIFPRKVLADDLTPDFRLEMCLKDISLAMELGASLGLALTLGAAARNQFALAKSWGRQDQDCTAILPLLHEVHGASQEHH